MEGGRLLPRKRVRFSYDEPDQSEDDHHTGGGGGGGAEPSRASADAFQLVRDNTPEASRARKLRFPKGKKASAGRFDLFDGDEECGPGSDRDPRVAATERAVRRSKMAEQLVSSEDAAALDNIAAAEEEFQGGDLKDEHGIELEPFNLKQEREEGYFDAEGNYVEYQLDRDIKDAWLDSVEVDTRFAEKHLGQVSEDEDVTLSRADIGRIKRRIADALLPGETVLQALRRFKGSPKERKIREKMSDQVKAIFDQLTEDAMKLLDNGDYDVYHDTKETFQREAEGYEAISKALVGGSSNGAAHQVHTSHVGQLGTMDNIFASDDEEDSGRNADVSTVFNERQLSERPSDLGATSMDMFGDDEQENLSDGTGQVEGDKQVENIGNAEGNTLNNIPMYQNSESGYVYDVPTGYYYNQALGYYYDSASGLFCNASSGKWFSYEEESGTYVEVS